jgi:predicted nucleic acid-binding protein
VIVAFDSDVVIYAAEVGHPLGSIVLEFINADPGTLMGSVLLRPEVLTKPLRTDPDGDEATNLSNLLSRVVLVPCNDDIAIQATSLGVRYGLKAPDAVHLSTAVDAAADYFVTNNQKDFPKTITEIDIAYPADLPQILADISEPDTTEPQTD